MESKTCKKCAQVKPLSEFYKHPRAADGYLGHCKVCQRACVTRVRHENVERYRAYDNERSKTPERRAHIRRVSSEWKKADPRRNRCHNAVARAIRRGQMLKMDCEVCGSKQAIAHHDDYDYPLRVRWLCQAHHKQWHRDNPGAAE